MEFVGFAQVGDEFDELIVGFFLEELVAFVGEAGAEDDAAASFSPGGHAGGGVAVAAVAVDAYDQPVGFVFLDVGRGCRGNTRATWNRCGGCRRRGWWG